MSEKRFILCSYIKFKSPIKEYYVIPVGRKVTKVYLPIKIPHYCSGTYTSLICRIDTTLMALFTIAIVQIDVTSLIWNRLG